ncbi:putative tetratricopeptide-like helical domain, DYW domain-containing protein [Rosa chinensis]|uniref:Putative tetratricopeptide-like helical domain, DYW domain-containing protein n=1 Tax=Rosa chinensis TaxID=74649 RepID=A0A2P6P5Y4_ROSCH|nr:pentatricopeptide repeat-containing protein At1g05750, chloroplastic [Rosa chinensis]XP_024171334.1 pentatricopeptide repeat-containing protein At1g05750, chloroplastic [Rosa chinensis]XP_024171335.1 pentatricopeptide repeat-containing protein At1g05750, chloroplastic [Rosa chinensis]XP_024171336.1 pentatricopeptide repeat-containing protein At1g05750, chloroplastic [Rosa chinensis]XP_024171337.1 pentatricopeptide repeat-containing protein At1g05750, chloroplastic [Rosa chinensis]PRQ17314.1
MAGVRVRPQGSCSLRPSEPLHCYKLRGGATTVSFASKFQSLCCKSQFPGNPSRKSNSRGGFSRNCSRIDVVSAGELIKRYVENGNCEDAIVVYVKMLELGLPVAEEFQFFPILIKAFGGLCDVGKAREIHGHVLKLGVLGDVYDANSILGVYWKCGEVDDAVQMFEKMPERDLVSWNTMISGFCHSGDYVSSLGMFSRMVRDHWVLPNRVACLSALTSCSSLHSLVHGREIHGFALKRWLDGDQFMVSGLIDMYMKCGDVKNAERVYRSVIGEACIRENTVIWNVMISGYVSNGCWPQAAELFLEMLAIGFLPDTSTMVAITGLCSHLMDLAFGKQIHKFCLSTQLNTDVRVETALMDMYFKCGDSTTGLEIFRRSLNRNMVMWGAAISNFAQSSHPREALNLFHDYILEYGFVDSVIILAILRACSSLAVKSIGMEIHGLLVKLGFDSDHFVASALVDFYSKTRDIESAQKVFHRLPARDLVSWNALISGYTQNEYLDEALKAFLDMQLEEIRPNTVTVASILSVCAQLSIMMLCKEVHGYLIRQEFESNVLVSNSLMTTYAKCGDIKSSRSVFVKMPERNLVSWNSILLGLGVHGHADETFALFEKMEAAGLEPDHATFTALLSACSHAGRIEEGLKYFQRMVEVYKIEPQLEQYTCMVDLLGRAGHLKQAYDIISTMPCASDDRIWGSLLGSCKIHGDERLAEVVADHIFKLDPTNIGYRTLLANLYEGYGKWNDVTRVRSDIKGVGLKKMPGCSWIEVDNNLHTFTAGDHSHNEAEEIYFTIENLTTEIRKAGYIPQLLTLGEGLDEVLDEDLTSSRDKGLLFLVASTNNHQQVSI